MSYGFLDRLRFLFHGVPPTPRYLVPADYRGELWLSLHDGDPGEDGAYEVRVIGRRPVQFNPPVAATEPLTTDTTTFGVPVGAAFSHWALWRPWGTRALKTGQLPIREEFHFGGQFDLAITLNVQGGATWPTDGEP